MSVLGVGLGFLADTWSDYHYVKWLERYESFVLQEPISTIKEPYAGETQLNYHPTDQRTTKLLWKDKFFSVEYISYEKRSAVEGKSFQKFSGPEMGIT